MDINKNYIEKWHAIKNEMDAQADKFDAELKMKYNDAMKDFSTELEAGKDWLDADWNEFKARINKWWNELQIEINKVKE